jgi:hypothetical protein
VHTSGAHNLLRSDRWSGSRKDCRGADLARDRRIADGWFPYKATLCRFLLRASPPEPELQHAALRLTTRDWEDVRSTSDPHELALEFARSAFQHAWAVCDWDWVLARSAERNPPPIS